MSSARDVLINILTKGDASGTEKVSGSLDQLADKADKVGKSLSLKVTAPLVALGGAAIYASTQFDSAFREVTTLLDEPAEAIATLRQDIRDMAAELGVDLVDSTNAAYNALSAGVPKDNLISFLETAAKTGIAGVASTNESVELLTGLMNTYGIEMTRAGEVSDLLFTTVKNGVTTIPKLAQALGQVAPTASSAGVELDELLAAMATITKQTGNTAQASTGLSAAIISLLNPSETLAGIYKEQGIEGGRALIQQRGLAGALDLVAQATKGNDKAFFQALGSVEAYRAAVNLTGDNAQKAKADLDAMAGSAGATQEAFEKMDDGPGRAMDKLKASATELFNVLGDQMLPTVITVTEALTDAAKAASDLPGPIIKVGIAIGGLAAAAGPGLIVTGSLIKNFRVLQSVAPKTAAVIAKSGGIAAAAMAGFALGSLIDEWTGFSDKVADVFEAFDGHNKGLASGLERNRQAMADQVGEIQNLADKERVRGQIIRERGLMAEQERAAIAAGEKDIADQYAQQISNYDGFLRALDGIIDKNKQRTEAEKEAAQAAAAQAPEALAKAMAEEATTAQLERQKALRETLLSDIDLEMKILQAKIDGNDEALKSLQDQKREQVIINQLKKTGVSEDEAIAKAEKLVSLQNQARDAENKRNAAKLTGLQLDKESLALQDKADKQRIKEMKLAQQKASAVGDTEGAEQWGRRIQLAERMLKIEQETSATRREAFFLAQAQLRKEQGLPAMTQEFVNSANAQFDREEAGQTTPPATPPGQPAPSGGATPPPASGQPTGSRQTGQTADMSGVVEAINKLDIDTSGVIRALAQYHGRVISRMADLEGQIGELGN